MPALSSPLLSLKVLMKADVIPFSMMANNSAPREIAAGTVMAADMVEPPTESLLWSLRRKLERSFGLS